MNNNDGDDDKNNEAGPVNEGVVIRNTEEFLRNLPPGYRFFPTDYELVVHYLAKKVRNQTLPIDIIPEVKLYEAEPEKLTARRGDISHDGVWYFFTRRERKYANGLRPSRSTVDGFWKPTGNEKIIKNNLGRIVGYKKTLDYLTGKNPNGQKTIWKMHEYRMERKCPPPNPKAAKAGNKNDKSNTMMMDEFVLCRIYQNSQANKYEKSANAIIFRGVPNEEAAASQPATHVAPVSYNALAISNANETGPGTSSDMTNVPIANPPFPARITGAYTSYNSFHGFTNCFGSNMRPTSLPPEVYHVVSPSFARQAMYHLDVHHVASPSSGRPLMVHSDLYRVASPSIISARPLMVHQHLYCVASTSTSARPPLLDGPATLSATYLANDDQQLLTMNQDFNVQADSMNDPPLMQPISSESFTIPDDDLRDDDINYEDLDDLLNFEGLDEKDRSWRTNPGNRQN